MNENNTVVKGVLGLGAIVLVVLAGAAVLKSGYIQTATSIRSVGNVTIDIASSQKTVSTIPTTCVTGSSPSIKILYPNGGEILTPGQQVNIKIKTCNIQNQNPLAQIDIMDDRVFGQSAQSLFGAAPILNYATLISSINNEKVYNYVWTIPVQFTLLPPYQGTFGGPHYKAVAFVDSRKFTAGSATPVFINDWSDNVFTLRLPGCNSYYGFSSYNGLACWITTNPAMFVTSTNATLKGDLLDGAPATIGWSLTPSVGGISNYVQNTPGSLNANIGNLTPNTTYQFQVCSTNSTFYAPTTCAQWLSFTTSP